jgi:hypothetical protein
MKKPTTYESMMSSLKGLPGRIGGALDTMNQGMSAVGMAGKMALNPGFMINTAAGGAPKDQTPAGGAFPATPGAAATPQAPAPDQPPAIPGSPPSEKEVMSGVFRQGNSYYGKGGQGVSPGTLVEGAGGQLGPGGFAASTSGAGAFGRSPQEQTAIESRVGEIQRATDFIRGMRDIPSELDRFKQQAQQRISLNQGLGGFLNQASQRNYARERVGELEEGALDQAKLAQEATQQGFDNALALQEANKGAFKTTTIVGPDGVERPLITDTATGQTTIGDAPQRQMSESEARAEYSRLADQEWSNKGGFLTSEKDVFKIGDKGVSREEWIEAQVKKATGQGQKSKIKYSKKELEETAKKYGMTPEEVEARLNG